MTLTEEERKELAKEQRRAAINTGGSAFPAQYEYVNGEREHMYGMTLRDYYAGQALQGLLAGRYFGEADKPRKAYILADAMIAARGE